MLSPLSLRTPAIFFHENNPGTLVMNRSKPLLWNIFNWTAELPTASFRTGNRDWIAKGTISKHENDRRQTRPDVFRLCVFLDVLLMFPSIVLLRPEFGKELSQRPFVIRIRSLAARDGFLRSQYR